MYKRTAKAKPVTLETYNLQCLPNSLIFLYYFQLFHILLIHKLALSPQEVCRYWFENGGFIAVAISRKGRLIFSSAFRFLSCFHQVGFSSCNTLTLCLKQFAAEQQILMFSGGKKKSQYLVSDIVKEIRIVVLKK